MCTVLLRLVPDTEWPVQLAFVRDEDRSRPSDPPARWWDHAPTVIGGRDARAGGTWLAVDPVRMPAVALLTDQYDPGARLPDPSRSPTRGTLPIVALERRALFDLEPDVPGDVRSYQPFHLVSLHVDAGAWAIDRWGWNGSELDHQPMGAGDHVVASRAVSLDGEASRRARLLEQLGSIPPGGPGHRDAWKQLLDARHVEPDQLDQVAIHSVSQRPGFGTVGASLVAISSDGRVSYEFNRTTNLDPQAWTRIHVR